MAESTKQITFEQTCDKTTSQTIYKIKRLFNMHTYGLKIGEIYLVHEFENVFVQSIKFDAVDIILE